MLSTLLKWGVLISICSIALSSVEIREKCHINKSSASCSDRQLTFIPSYLPRNITKLQFGNNKLGNLTVQTFANVSCPTCRLNFLNITENHIKHISKDTFIRLLFLRTLILDKNLILKSSLTAAFESLNHPHLHMLSLNNMSLQCISDDFFHNLNRSGVYQIYMRHNDFHTFAISALRRLPNLDSVDISQNFIYHLELSDLGIRSLNLGFNLLSLLKTNNYSMPALRKLYLMHNDLLYIYKKMFSSFPHIEYIDLSMNPILQIAHNAFSFLPNLTELKLDNICGLSLIKDYAFSNNHVKRISLKNNEIQFENKSYASNMFSGCKSLEHLDLGGNIMISTSEEYLKSLFEPIRHTVRELSLSDNILRTFPKAVTLFTNLKYLNLDSNELTGLNRDDFPPTLGLIKLYDNDITSVNEYSLPENLEDIVIDLGYNPFECTCELLWFLEVFTNDKFNKTFEKSGERYICASPSFQAGKNLTDFAKTIGWQSCLLASTTSLIIMFANSFLVILIIVGSALYYYRWHFRYFLFLLRRHRLGQRPGATAEFKYDAFLCYSDKDLNWVLKEAIPKLEEQANIQLCINQRDYELGALKADNIVRCVNDSRRFIIVLSDNFAATGWCLFELAVIQRQLRSEGEGFLVIVKLGAIDQRHMTDSLFHLLTTRECIEYPEEPSARELFWTQVVQSLREDANTRGSVPHPVVSAGGSVPHPVASAGGSVPHPVASARGSVPHPVVRAGGSVPHPVASAGGSVPHPVASAVGSVPHPVASAVGSVPHPVVSAGGSVPHPVARAGGSVPHPVVSAGGSVPHPVASAGGSVPHPVARAGGSVPHPVVSAGGSVPHPVASMRSSPDQAVQLV